VRGLPATNPGPEGILRSLFCIQPESNLPGTHAAVKTTFCLRCPVGGYFFVLLPLVFLDLPTEALAMQQPLPDFALAISNLLRKRNGNSKSAALKSRIIFFCVYIIGSLVSFVQTFF
jgi:hypothetical protein